MKVKIIEVFYAISQHVCYFKVLRFSLYYLRNKVRIFHSFEKKTKKNMHLTKKNFRIFSILQKFLREILVQVIKLFIYIYIYIRNCSS